MAPLLVGILLIGLGLALLVQTISLFATIGHGTLAPWLATRKLIVHGVYRHVRTGRSELTRRPVRPYHLH